MTVKELIEALQTLPEDLPVVVFHQVNGAYSEVDPFSVITINDNDRQANEFFYKTEVFQKFRKVLAFGG